MSTIPLSKQTKQIHQDSQSSPCCWRQDSLKHFTFSCCLWGYSFTKDPPAPWAMALGWPWLLSLIHTHSPWCSSRPVLCCQGRISLLPYKEFEGLLTSQALYLRPASCLYQSLRPGRPLSTCLGCSSGTHTPLSCSCVPTHSELSLQAPSMRHAPAAGELGPPLGRLSWLQQGGLGAVSPPRFTDFLRIPLLLCLQNFADNLTLESWETHLFHCFPNC